MDNPTEVRTGGGGPRADVDDAVGQPFSRLILSRSIILAVILQAVGYGVVWFINHAPNLPDRRGISNETMVSAGWYAHGSAYREWALHLPLLGQLLESHAVRTFGLAAGFGLAAAGYVIAVVLARRTRMDAKLSWLLLVTAAIALPLLTVPQMMSSDVWSYAFYGRIPVVHGGNPFVQLPSSYPDDPLLPRLYWKSTASVYGPAWVGVSMVLTVIAQLLGGAAWAYLVVFKAFIFACHLANVALVYRILSRVRPEMQAWGAIFYGWNPLVLFEFVCNCHNDAFMLTLVLVAIACAAGNCSNRAVAWMTVAGLAKLTGLLGLPVYVLYVARQSSRPVLTVARLAGVSLAVVVLLYAPFWHGMATFRGTANAPNFKILHHSAAAAASAVLERSLETKQKLNQWLDEQPAPGSQLAILHEGVRKTCLAIFAISFLLLTIWPVRSLEQWIERMIWLFAAYLVLASLFFNSWYGTWLVPLASLVLRRWSLLVISSLFFLLFYLPMQPTGIMGVLLYWPWPLLVAAGWRLWHWRLQQQPAAAILTA